MQHYDAPNSRRTLGSETHGATSRAAGGAVRAAPHVAAAGPSGLVEMVGLHSDAANSWGNSNEEFYHRGRVHCRTPKKFF